MNKLSFQQVTKIYTKPDDIIFVYADGTFVDDPIKARDIYFIQQISPSYKETIFGYKTYYGFTGTGVHFSKKGCSNIMLNTIVKDRIKLDNINKIQSIPPKIGDYICTRISITPKGRTATQWSHSLLIGRRLWDYLVSGERNLTKWEVILRIKASSMKESELLYTLFKQEQDQYLRYIKEKIENDMEKEEEFELI